MTELKTRLRDWVPTLAIIIVFAGTTGAILAKFAQQWGLSRLVMRGLGFAIIFVVSSILIGRRRQALRERDTR